MARRLVLIRHAKTEQAEPDISRVLTNRGRRDAGAVGAWLAAHEAEPDRVVVSPASRARETWDLAKVKITAAPAMVVDERIYDNDAHGLLAIATETDPSVRTVALVGHNPSVHALAASLAGKGSGGGAERLRDEFPTAGVAVFEISGEWADLSAKSAKLAAFHVCRG